MTKFVYHEITVNLRSPTENETMVAPQLSLIVIPAQAGIQAFSNSEWTWIPASAGMTNLEHSIPSRFLPHEYFRKRSQRTRIKKMKISTQLRALRDFVMEIGCFHYCRKIFWYSFFFTS